MLDDPGLDAAKLARDLMASRVRTSRVTAGELADSMLEGADALYDSSAVAHDARWDLPLPDLAATRAYAVNVLEAMLAPGDAECAGGVFELGARPGSGFVFDNEKWAHEVRVAPFRISRAPVTNAQVLEYVEAGGKAPHEPAVNLSWDEAQGWCRWAGRRLPSEAEWAHAAAKGVLEGRGLVWEWTASDFGPYPGFSPDPYRDYSVPWFGSHKVLRGGSFSTLPRAWRVRGFAISTRPTGPMFSPASVAAP